MTGEMITCPSCGHEFQLNKALTKELELSMKVKFDGDLAKIKKDLEKASEDLKYELESQVKKNKLVLEAKIREEVKFSQSVELEDLKSSLQSKEKALSEANEKELAFRKEKRDLEEREKNLKLEVERTLDRERDIIIEKAARDADAVHQRADGEKDKKIADALNQVEELKRKMTQGSSQTQGEIFELKMEETLRVEFPFDTIEEIAKGIKGGDILVTVKTKAGVEVGCILLELKRTKAFSESWLQKLRSDARAAKADLCMLVTETLPADIESFAEMNGVWVCSIQNCIPLAHALREILLRVARERSMQSGKKDKAAMIYEYIISVEFRNRLEAIVEYFRGMKGDLDSERRAMEKIWAKREKSIGQVLLQVAGMHGDLEALAGSALPQIKILELPQK